MGQGSGTSAEGAAGGGGMGLGILGSLTSIFGGGGAGQASGASSPSTTPYYIENPNVGTSGGVDPGLQSSPSLATQIGQLLKDPKVLQSFADVAKNLGKTIEAGDKVPGHAAAMLQAATAGGSTGGLGYQSPGPFVGDAANFTPAQAQTILQALGIPGGFNPLRSR